jgi:4-amino-4-deoxy-L-arabinose transferase
MQLELAIVSLFFYLFSIFLFVNKKASWALFALLLGTITIRLFMSNELPYLNDWDERFHALVGKNMIENPLKPTLYNHPLLPYDIKDWDKNHIWLHKEPLFLWIIGLSIKIFGVSELAVRIPSIIASCILVLISYRIGSLIRNKNTGFIAALLMSTNYFSLILCCGFMGMEHNDTLFLLFVSLSIWSWVEWIFSKNNKWIILIGIFSGGAILIKWVVGLLVYLVWFLYSFLVEKSFFTRKNIVLIPLSLLCCLAIVVPWHIWIFSMYPQEAQLEIGLFFTRFSKNVGQATVTNKLYYLDELKNTYTYLFLFIVPSLLIFIKRDKNWKILAVFMLSILFVYIFFSVASTKTPAYVYVVALLVLLFVSIGIDYISSLFCKNKFLIILTLTFIAYININVTDLVLVFQPNNTCYWGGQRKRKIHNTNYFKLLSSELDPKNDVVIFCKNKDELEVMFYTGCIAYPALDSTQINSIQNSHKNIFAFDTKELPSFVTNNKNITILPFEYKTNEW